MPGLTVAGALAMVVAVSGEKPAAESRSVGGVVAADTASSFTVTPSRVVVSMALTADAFIALRLPSLPNCTITPRDGSDRVTAPVLL